MPFTVCGDTKVIWNASPFQKSIHRRCVQDAQLVSNHCNPVVVCLCVQVINNIGFREFLELYPEVGEGGGHPGGRA